MKFSPGVVRLIARLDVKGPKTPPGTPPDSPEYQPYLDVKGPKTPPDSPEYNPYADSPDYNPYPNSEPVFNLPVDLDQSEIQQALKLDDTFKTSE